MRLHRFYIKEVSIDRKQIQILGSDLLHQWRNVFRYNTGSKVVIFCGDGFEYECVILQLTNREAVLEVVEKREGERGFPGLVLYQSLIKKGNMEWVVEKATELGVVQIVPIVSEHSEKKGFNMERAKKIAIEASEQCGRVDVPEISSIMELEECIKEVSGKAVAFDKSGASFSEAPPPNPLPQGEGAGGGVSIFIGPEGGWSAGEIEKFKEVNIKILSLGNLTLRAETAAIVALTISRLLG